MKVYLTIHRCEGEKGSDGIFFLADVDGYTVYEGHEWECKEWAKDNGFGIRRDS